MDFQEALEKLKTFANSKQGRIAIVGSTILGLTFLIANLDSDSKPVVKEKRKEYSRTLIDEKTRQKYMEELEAESQRTKQEVNVLREEIDRLRQLLSKELKGPSKPNQVQSQAQPQASQYTRPSYSTDPRLIQELRALRRSLETLNSRVNQIENKVEQQRAPVSPNQLTQQIPKVQPPTVRTIKPGQNVQNTDDSLLEDFYPAEEDKEIEKKLEESVSQREKICIPQGSFGKVVALTGLSAPTGPRASQDPVPMLFTIPDKFIKPNLKRTYEVRDCFAIGWGAGDLSSERIKIKVKSVSCEIKGERIKIPVQGYIAGPDGKEGIKGILVEKRGQYLAKALMAAFVEGLAAVARYSTTVVSVSPLGATQTIPPDQAFKYGLGAGASESLKKLSDYYLQLADEVLPVIEVGSGVSGTLVLLQEACEGSKQNKMWKEAVAETKEKFKGINLKAPQVQLPNMNVEVKPFYGGAQ